MPALAAKQRNLENYATLLRALSFKLNGVPPVEIDFQRYFKTSPPTIHNMILKLEEKGFIQRKPKTPRSIKHILLRAELPDLE